MKNFTVGTILFSVFALFLFWTSLFTESGMPRVLQLQESVDAQTRLRKSLRSYNRDLKEKIVRLSSDDEYLEQQARERLSLVRPNEVMVVFQD